MAAEITVQTSSGRAARRSLLPSFGLSWRIMGLVVAGVMMAEVLLFLQRKKQERDAAARATQMTDE